MSFKIYTPEQPNTTARTLVAFYGGSTLLVGSYFWNRFNSFSIGTPPDDATRFICAQNPAYAIYLNVYATISIAGAQGQISVLPYDEDGNLLAGTSYPLELGDIGSTATQRVTGVTSYVLDKSLNLNDVFMIRVYQTECATYISEGAPPNFWFNLYLG
jgi:hypothetical protein